jgi:hypothetical protein
MADEMDPNIGNDKSNDADYVVFSLDDENIDNLGKIIGTKYSREFLKITQKDELNLKEIAKIVENSDNPRLPNPTHHKNRLEKLGLIISRLKQQRKRGHTLHFYKGKQVIIIVPAYLVETIQNNEDLKRIFNDILKS